MRRVYAAMGLALGLAGCSSDDDGAPVANPSGSVQPGESAVLAGGEVSTWAELDAQGGLVRLGLKVAAAAIDGAAQNAEVHPAVPPAASGSTPFDHVGLGYQAHGHGPSGVYDVPHFDVHFYMVTPEEREAIDCVDEPMPAEDRLPSPYFIPGTGLEPDGTCVPAMGIHALNPLAPELAQVDPAPFTHTLIYGYHDGELAFVEPMVTQEHLSARDPFAYDIERPGGIPANDLWPTRLSGTYDPNDAAYHIVLDGFAPGS